MKAPQQHPRGDVATNRTEVRTEVSQTPKTEPHPNTRKPIQTNYTDSDRKCEQSD